MSDTQVAADELQSLKDRADLMGLSYHPSIGVEKLREKVNAAIAGKPPVVADSAPRPVAQPVEETENERNNRMRQEQLALVRIRLTCMDPAKAEHDGEILTVGNSLVGAITKYIPYNADEGWHVPQIMLDTLLEKQTQIFVTTKARNGVTVRQGKLIKTYAIEILPPLTPEELKDLAQRQAMAATAD